MIISPSIYGYPAIARELPNTFKILNNLGKIAEDINGRLVGTAVGSNISITSEEVHNLMFDNEKYLNIAKMIATEQTRILKEKEKSKIKETVQHKTKPKIDFNDNQNHKKLILGKIDSSL